MKRPDVAPREAEVPMVEARVVKHIRVLAEAGLGSKRIAGVVGVARNTVRRYLAHNEAAEEKERPTARRLERGEILAARGE